jgi:hypothetical protein
VLNWHTCTVLKQYDSIIISIHVVYICYHLTMLTVTLFVFKIIVYLRNINCCRRQIHNWHRKISKYNTAISIVDQILKDSKKQNSSYRTTLDLSTDGRTDGRTWWNQHSPRQLRCGGGGKQILHYNRNGSIVGDLWKPTKISKITLIFKDYYQYACSIYLLSFDHVDCYFVCI